VAHTCNLNYSEVEIWRTAVQDQHKQIVHETPISKISREKWTGGITQAIECMLCKYESLSSNLIPQKKINPFGEE
jgi:hypothetical protein